MFIACVYLPRTSEIERRYTIPPANNYGPTTPAPPPKKPRQRSNSARPVAGPSTKPPFKQAASKKPVSKAIELEDEDEEVVFVESPSSKKRKNSEEPEQDGGKGKGAKKAPVRAKANANGATKAAPAKGKARADAPAIPNGASGDAMDVDKDDVLEVDEDEPPDPPVQRVPRGVARPLKAKGGVTAAAAARQAKVEERLNREVEHLRAQLEQSRESAKEVAAQRDKLASQLEEVFRVRQTEAEQALADYKAHFDESMKRKESLIQELTSRLTSLQSPSKASKSDQSYTLHFLTREAAEEEKRALKEENARLLETVKQRDAWLAGKDQQMNALRDEAKTLRMELDAEIERSKHLLTHAQHAPGPAFSGPSRRTDQEVKNAPVIRIYEDMTNVLITSVKMERSPEFPEIEEEYASCIYTYINEDIKFCKKPSATLNFTLRNNFEKPVDHPPGQPLTREQLLQKVRYQPRDLDKENPDIVGRLGFFKEPFMFSRDQMAVFLKTLTETVAGVFEVDENGEPPSSQVEITVVE
ncbi:hypothetical protein K466DRAFT_486803 [Polyporus arcularius HHB13444]|uniref:Monopolin complex subunit Csm1/Pcs1 C-terminal domain-containing protein n=1 Tax=Polyporus arcularius HHB13444 TaxID=1314778 RepID=A0A5C3PJL2_9APHY|nr:hypothetical protein K466DRAFT_486803 [Polyporus arcularius HHB13444]